MTDYARADRHRLYRRIAEWTRVIAVILLVPEVMEAIKYHFPVWDDIAMPVTMVVGLIANFVYRKTEMYEV